MAAAPVDIRHEDDVVVARIGGDIDISNRSAVASRILGAVSNECSGLCLDLSPVRYLDSAGISLLFELARHLETGRQRMGIALDEDSPVRTLLKITNMHEVVTLCASVPECISTMRGGL